MTMVAAFNVKGMPVLIGDMAVTIGTMRSLRKKAYLIAPNLVIAWAGHMSVAKSLRRSRLRFPAERSPNKRLSNT